MIARASSWPCAAPRKRSVRRKPLSGSHSLVFVDRSKIFGALPHPRSFYSGDEPEIDVSHPNAAGYALMANQLLPIVRRAGGK